MTRARPILCAGAALWDVIGRAGTALPYGADVPGRVVRRPGGVALNIALALAALGRSATLLAAIGTDAAGDALVLRLRAAGVGTAGLHRQPGESDTYLAIEDAGGELHAAIADCRCLEAAGHSVLAPLRDGRLPAPWPGPVVADGNLPPPVLAALLDAAAAAGAPLALVPASPGKAAALAPLATRHPLTLYLNRIEAERLCAAAFPDSRAAALALRAHGVAEAIVTDGAAVATAASAGLVVGLMPPPVGTRSVTGAGDAFVAAHLAARADGLPPEPALAAALSAAARHIELEPA